MKKATHSEEQSRPHTDHITTEQAGNLIRIIPRPVPKAPTTINLYRTV